MVATHAFLLESLEHHQLLLNHIDLEIICGEPRILFSTTEESFPFVLRNVIRGDKENIIILSGVADTRKRGRHFARIEYRVDSRMGAFF